jgi:hypothetical protein
MRDVNGGKDVEVVNTFQRPLHGEALRGYEVGINHAEELALALVQTTLGPRASEFKEFKALLHLALHTQ